MSRPLRNKQVYEWLHNGEVFYVGIGGKRRPYSRARGNTHCMNKRRKAEREKTFEIKITYKNLTWEEACAIECELIQQYGRIDLGTGCLTNMTNGGEGSPGAVRSKETRSKISQAMFNMTKNEDWKNSQSEMMKEKWRDGTYDNVKGRKHTPEIIELMREQKKRGRHPGAKPVQTPLGIFECGADAAEAHEISKMKLSRRIRDSKYPEYILLEE